MDIDLGAWAKYGVVQATLSAILIFIAVLLVGSFLALPFATLLVGGFFIVVLLALIGGAIVGVLEGLLYEFFLENPLDKYSNYWKAFALLVVFSVVSSLLAASLSLTGVIVAVFFALLNAWVILKIYDWRDWRLPF